LSQRLLLEPRLGDAHIACLHLILAHVNDHASEHARVALELYRTIFDGVELPEEAERVRRRAVELAEELLEEALKLEEEEAGMLEGVHMAYEDEGEGDVDSEKGADVVKEADEASEQKSGQSAVNPSTDTDTEAAATKQTPLKTSQPSKRIDSFNPEKQ
jgi:hypothetical protein